MRGGKQIWILGSNKIQQEGSGSASFIDQKGVRRHSERFGEFRGFQFSGRFQKVLRRIQKMIGRFEVLEALLLDADHLDF